MWVKPLRHVKKINTYHQTALDHLDYTLLFYQIEPYKKGPFLVLPSSIARNLSAPNAKRFFQIHRGIIEGCTNRARPSWPSEKLPKWHFLTPAWNLKIFWVKCLLLMYCESAIEWFFPKVSQAPSKCFSKWINWIISRIPRWIWKILFVLSSYEFLAMLEGKIWKCPFS